MKKIHLAILFILFFSPAIGQMSLNRTEPDSAGKPDMLSGFCSRYTLEKGIMQSFFQRNYTAYQPDTTVVQKLTPLLSDDDIVIVIIMGSWCSDSQEQVPRFFKVLDQCHISMADVKIIGVNHQKKSAYMPLDIYNITKVPTFILIKNHVELGRIIETPQLSFEKDLLKILGGL